MRPGASHSAVAGDKVTITFHAAINGTTNGYIRNGDGKIVFNVKQLNLDQTAGGGGGDAN